MYSMKKGGGSKSAKQQAAIAISMKAAGKKPKMQDGGNATGAFAKSLTVKKATYDSATNKIKTKIDSARNAIQQKIKDIKQKPKMQSGGQEDFFNKFKKPASRTPSNIMTKEEVAKRTIPSRNSQKERIDAMASTDKSKITDYLNKQRSMYQMKKGGKPKMKKGGFPDLTGDGKVTKADILKGRGVIKKYGGSMKSKKK